MKFDLLVLGGGPGGYVAALRAAQLGLKVGLIEKEFLGGVCLNKGCIPSKTLLACAELYSKIMKAGEWGIELKEKPLWDTAKLFEKKDQIIARMRQGLDVLCEKRKVSRIRGFGRFVGPMKIRVDEDVHSAANIILATGSVPKKPDLGISDKSRVFSSEEALFLKEIPETLLILGGGPEGCEFSLIYGALGSKVVLVEAQDRVLPGFDRDAGSAIRRVLTAKQVEVHTGEMLSKASLRAGKINAELKSGKTLSVDAVLVSVGRTPNTENMGLEKAGVRLNEKRAVIVDDVLRTTADNIYAVGDLTGRCMMAHSASYEGYVTASRLAGRPEDLDYTAVPSCVYTYPEAAQVGLSEEKVKEQNIPYEVGRFSFMALGRSHAKGETEGFVKIIGHAKTGEVVGGLIVGSGASDLINILSLAVKHKLKVADIRGHIAPHPSGSEAVVEAAHLFFKEGLHFA